MEPRILDGGRCRLTVLSRSVPSDKMTGDGEQRSRPARYNMPERPPNHGWLDVPFGKTTDSGNGGCDKHLTFGGNVTE